MPLNNKANIMYELNNINNTCLKYNVKNKKQ